MDKQVSKTLHFVRRNILVRAAKTGPRTDRPQFSERAAFEAIANAVAHRDCSIVGFTVIQFAEFTTST